MSKKRIYTNDDEPVDKDEQAIKDLITNRSEMVKALKKVLDKMNKRNDKDTENKWNYYGNEITFLCAVFADVIRDIVYG